jgi:hypothetical protein
MEVLLMAEILTAGYEDIREHIIDTWIWIELRDEIGDPVVRLSTADPRVSFTSLDPTVNPIELVITVEGADGDIPVPTTFRYSAIFNVGTLGSPFSVEEFTQFTINAPEDQLTVRHRIQVPQIL